MCSAKLAKKLAGEPIRRLCARRNLLPRGVSVSANQPPRYDNGDIAGVVVAVIGELPDD